MFKSYVMCNAKRPFPSFLSFSLFLSVTSVVRTLRCAHSTRESHSPMLRFSMLRTFVLQWANIGVCATVDNTNSLNSNNTRKTKATPGPEYQQQILFIFSYYFLFFFLSRPSIAANATATVFRCCFYTFSFAVSQLIKTEVRNTWCSCVHCADEAKNTPKIRDEQKKKINRTFFEWSISSNARINVELLCFEFYFRCADQWTNSVERNEKTILNWRRPSTVWTANEWRMGRSFT